MENKALIIKTIAILVVVAIITAGIVALSDKNKESITPNAEYTKSLSEEQMLEIKLEYELEGNKEEFVELYNNIEQTVAAKLLDGTVTTDSELKEEIERINNMFSTSNWDYLNLIYPSYWMGTWKLDNTGKLTFTFRNVGIKPNWVSEIEMKDYVK